MKVKELRGIFSNFTTCKIVENGVNDVWKGFAMDMPVEYSERYIECVIPVVNPENTKIGMASIILLDED